VEAFLRSIPGTSLLVVAQDARSGRECVCPEADRDQSPPRGLHTQQLHTQVEIMQQRLARSRMLDDAIVDDSPQPLQSGAPYPLAIWLVKQGERKVGGVAWRINRFIFP